MSADAINPEMRRRFDAAEKVRVGDTELRRPALRPSEKTLRAHFKSPIGKAPVELENPHVEPKITAAERTRAIPASVLIAIVLRDSEPTVLVTQRHQRISYPGHWVFPGGRADADDSTPIETALREAEEEIGLTADFVDVIGNLDIYEVRTGFEVFPVVGLVRTGFDLKLDHDEVADVFEVPLSFVLDPRNHHRQSRTFYGRQRYFYVLPFEDRYIWGATAGMLINLYEVLTGEKASWR